MTSFNLVDSEWIRVRDTNGAQREVSLTEVLTSAHELARINGDVPTQEFALLRLLLAIVRRAVPWGDNPLDAWAKVWQAGRLPADEIEAYLQRVHDRFDLLARQTPFYQVADLALGKTDLGTVELLLADVPAREKYFSTRAGSGALSLSLAEAARWLVHCHCFDAAGIKTGDPRDPRTKAGKGYGAAVGWGGQIGGVVFEGNTLFETLMLNTVLTGPDGTSALPDDLPVWERPHPSVEERHDLPTGPCDVLTWQSRRIRLVTNDDRVVNVVVANGDSLTPANRFAQEFMTGWRYSEPQSKKARTDQFWPMQWSADRALWRGVEGLTGDIDGSGVQRRAAKASGTAHWLNQLLTHAILDRSTTIRAHAYAMTYRSNASVVGEAIDDVLPMRIAVLDREGEARMTAVAAVDSAVDSVRALAGLASRLAQAAGGDGTGALSSAQAQGFFALDEPFRAWLRNLGDNPDEGALEGWQATVRRVVTSEGRQLVDSAGHAARRGREVGGQWLDTAVADEWFRRALRAAIPYAYQEVSMTGGAVE